MPYYCSSSEQFFCSSVLPCLLYCHTSLEGPGSAVRTVDCGRVHRRSHYASKHAAAVALQAATMEAAGMCATTTRRSGVAQVWVGRHLAWRTRSQAPFRASASGVRQSRSVAQQECSKSGRRAACSIVGFGLWSTWSVDAVDGQRVNVLAHEA